MNIDQIPLEDLFIYEISPDLTLLFSDSGDGYHAKNKSALRNKLKVEMSMKKEEEDLVILDGCAVLCNIHWPKDTKLFFF